jgi:hypothetical protein
VFTSVRVHPVEAVALFALLLSPLAGCGLADQTPLGESAGFLGDTSQLRPGRGDQAQLIYIDPEADFSSYLNVIVDPVVVWHGKGSDFSDVTPEELDSLARNLESSMREQLAHEFQVLDEPAPGTLRLRIALVELKISGGSGADAVGSVALELEILDAVSGRRLVAVADSRGQGAGDATATDVLAAFDEWAKRARDRLATFRDFDAAHAGGAASQ